MNEHGLQVPGQQALAPARLSPPLPPFPAPGRCAGFDLVTAPFSGTLLVSHKATEVWTLLPAQAFGPCPSAAARSGARAAGLTPYLGPTPPELSIHNPQPRHLVRCFSSSSFSKPSPWSLGRFWVLHMGW